MTLTSGFSVYYNLEFPENLNESFKGNTETGLDSMLEIIRNDPGLNESIPQIEILTGMYYGNIMNKIIIDSIIMTNIAIDDNFSTSDMKELNSYINSNYYSDWVIAHGDDENDEETGYHLVQNDGATTNIMGKNAVNTVIDGIYHLGFEPANENQVQNEDGNANAKYSNLAKWLNYFLGEDFNGTKLVGNLELTQVKLNIQDEITSDKISFSLKINNEIFDLRQIKIKPIIICDNIRATLSENSGFLTSSASSSVNSKVNTFNFKVNLNDFNTKIYNICKFQVELTDNFETSLILEKAVLFTKLEEEKKIQSISGRASDIANYMDTTLLNGMNKGQNSLEFSIKNNENQAKEYSITLVIQDLNIVSTQKIKITANSEKSVYIPIYIKNDQKLGKYPIRFSISAGNDKQVKYSFINVK